MLADKLNDCGVNVARTGAHDETLERGETHRSVDTLAADRSRDRSAVAEVAHDDLCALWIEAALPDHLTRDKVVAGAVEAVATHLVLLVVLVGQCIEIGLLRHAHAESRIEHSDIRLAGHSRLAGLNAHEVCRIVKGSQVKAVRDCLLHVLIDQHRLVVICSAVNHAMADCRNLVRALDDTVGRIYQRLHDELNCLLVARHSCLDLILFAARRCVGQQRTVDADSLAESLREHALVLHINELIL